MLINCLRGLRSLLPRLAACPNLMYSHNKHDIGFCIPEKIRTCDLDFSSEDVMLGLVLNVEDCGFFSGLVFLFPLENSSK